jgi:hypothetical protein
MKGWNIAAVWGVYEPVEQAMLDGVAAIHFNLAFY